MPDAYPLIRAARYLGVAPWELARQPICWMDWALLFESAEHKAPAIAEKINEQREEVKRGGGKSSRDDDED